MPRGAWRGFANRTNGGVQEWRPASAERQVNPWADATGLTTSAGQRRALTPTHDFIDCISALGAIDVRFSILRVAILSISERLPHSSQYPPGAISSPACHLAKIELGHEILRSARGHFELPGN
jgi:hypothetical protein